MSRPYLTEQDLDRAEQKQAREMQVEGEWLNSALGGDVSAKAEWAPLEIDFSLDSTSRSRRPTVGEVMLQAFDYSGGPQIEEVLALLAKCAIAEPRNVDALRNEALDLLQRAAKVYAYYHADLEAA